MSVATDEIREDIEATRADLDEKIQQLTDKAHAAVDVRRHIARRPWVALGLATAAGFLLGGRRRAPRVAAPLAVPHVTPPRQHLGALGEAALVLLTSLTKGAVERQLRAFATDVPRRSRPRNPLASRARDVGDRSDSVRNGGQRS